MDHPQGVLKLSERISLLPVVHGNADSMLQLRSWLLEHIHDAIAVPLPESFRRGCLAGVRDLPTCSAVLQPPQYRWDESDESATWSYVPIDPCQPVIQAIRTAHGEHTPLHFVDMETDRFEPFSIDAPDPYALKKLSIEQFATACLPRIPFPSSVQVRQRMQFMAARLLELERNYDHLVMVCGLQEWPWLRSAYLDLRDQLEPHVSSIPESEETESPERYRVDARTLFFMLGELPYITGLYEKARTGLDSDHHLSIDGIKQLLMSARSSYLQDFGKRARKITPLLLSQCLKYLRNLTLMDRRLTPDLYSIAVASQQIMGDQFAIHVMNTAREYPFEESLELDQVRFGIDQVRLPDGEVHSCVSRLPGSPIVWRSLELRRQPEKMEKEKWESQWNPYSQCSWPPEDKLIESFRTRVMDKAMQILGADLAKTEKFSTSIQDGIDIRETLRHWYDGDIYVKVLPPSVGTLDCCVMLFDTPADPKQYPWRTTWYAEHKEESTLAFFATDFHQEVIGPGIALANYGGAMFLYPPRRIPDIWTDRSLEFSRTPEERLISAACRYSSSRQIAVLSPRAPGMAWKQIAKRFKKRLVHIPLAHFNDAMIQQLRLVHVLNGQEVRSFAAHFIRKA